MLKNGIILTFRKLRSQWVASGLFLGVLTICYLLLYSGLFYATWFKLAGVIIIIAAISLGSHPIIDKKDMELYKIWGARRKHILPFVIIQSSILSVIASLIAIALIDGLPVDFRLNVLMLSEKIWIAPLCTVILSCALSLFYYLRFQLTEMSISK
ncbi:MAG: hypothetical protein ABJH05_13405 [Fulvivirga sp.]